MTKPISNRQDGHDMVNHPPHYADTVPGIECIEVTRNFDFNCGNIIKYIWRAGSKAEDGLDLIQKELEDLRKAQFYLNDEIQSFSDKRIDSAPLQEDTLNLVNKALNHFTGNRQQIIQQISDAFSIAYGNNAYQKELLIIARNYLELEKQHVQSLMGSTR